MTMVVLEYAKLGVPPSILVVRVPHDVFTHPVRAGQVMHDAEREQGGLPVVLVDLDTAETLGSRWDVDALRALGTDLNRVIWTPWSTEA